MNRLLFVCMGNICRSPTAEGVMRWLVREAGLEHEIEIDSAGTGAGTPATRPTAARPRPPGRAASRSRARRARSPAGLRALRPAAGHGPREPPRAARRSRPPDAADKARLLREFDPARRGAPDLDVPDPYYGGPRRLRDGARPGRGRLPRPARRCGELATPFETPRAARSGTLERVSGGDINKAFRVQFEDESFGFVKTRADVAPGEYAAEAAGAALARRAGRAARARGARRGERARARLGRRGRAAATRRRSAPAWRARAPCDAAPARDDFGGRPGEAAAAAARPAHAAQRPRARLADVLRRAPAADRS